MRRLVVLLLGILSGGAALFLLNQTQEAAAPRNERPAVEMVSVVLTKIDLQPGYTTKREDFEMGDWPKSAAGPEFLTNLDATTFLETVEGSVVRRAVSQGMPMSKGDISAEKSGYLSSVLTPGMRAVAIATSADQTAGGFILPDNHVDVMLTVTCADDPACPNGARTEVLLEDVRVLAIDQAGTSEDQSGAMIGKTATLEVGPDDATKLVTAKQIGTLTLLLRAMGDRTLAAKPAAPVEPAEPAEPVMGAAADAADAAKPEAPPAPVVPSYDIRVVRQGVEQVYKLNR